MAIPKVTYFNGNDFTLYVEKIAPFLTEVNIIRTKNLDEKTINFLVNNKEIVYLHLLVNGMGGSQFEPKIQTPKTLFDNLKTLIQRGFPLGKILILVDPIIPNHIGLQSMELLLKVMIRYKGLKIRQVQFNVLPFFQYDESKIKKSSMSTSHYLKKQKELQEQKMIYGESSKNGFKILANRNIRKRSSYNQLKEFVTHMDNKQGHGTFMQYFKMLLNTFKNYIFIDTTTKDPIGIRELKAFGLRTSYIDSNGVGHKLIAYDSKTKDIKNVKLIRGSNPTQCPNKCVLCPFK